MDEAQDRTERIALAPHIAKLLISQRAKIDRAYSMVQVMQSVEMELRQALIADAGLKSEEFAEDRIENGADGSTFLVLIPPPLPMPPQPIPPQE